MLQGSSRASAAAAASTSSSTSSKRIKLRNSGGPAAMSTTDEEAVTLDQEQQQVYSATSTLLHDLQRDSQGNSSTHCIPSVVSLEIPLCNASNTADGSNATATTATLLGRSLTRPPRAPSWLNRSETVTLATPGRGHEALLAALQQQQTLEKLEEGLMLSTSLAQHLTELLIHPGNSSATTSALTSSAEALALLQTWGQSVPRRVCQHPFKKNDIVWVCKTCQADETCVLCHDCFSQSNHTGHDIAFYHAQAGGCCDCGDPDGT
jgi:Putative zinc finger in N-recognin (UBR box)